MIFMINAMKLIIDNDGCNEIDNNVNNGIENDFNDEYNEIDS